MTATELEHFKELLTLQEDNLSSWLDEPDSDRHNEIHKVQTLLGQVRHALGKVEDKTYGICPECHEEISIHNLEIQPAQQVCIDCISPEDKVNLEEELFLASKIHRALLPQSIGAINGFEIAVKSLSARTVGGDYYDFLPGFNGGITRVIIADIMGKGIPAGLLMSNIQGALKVLADDIQSPSGLIDRLNHWFCRNVPVTKFISLACIAVEPGSRNQSKITYTNAGHCPPILARKTGEVEILEPTGGVLGVHEGFAYEQRDLTLSSGDLILLYTDGVTEAENEAGEQFEEDKLKELLQGHGKKDIESIPEIVIEEVRAYTGKQEFGDDLTIIALRKK
ncbi:MAG: SpoIIE family protein phosphatase [candidate division Zixibacteria bacterium]|nr:SpoIIE family protein phosphatase [candidate division Zixibacteria bacterium]